MGKKSSFSILHFQLSKPSHRLLVPVDFVAPQLDDAVAPLAADADLLEALLRHHHPDFHGTQLVAQARVDARQYLRVRHEDAGLALHRAAVVRQDELLFQAGHFEVAVVLVRRPYLVVVQPVGKVAADQGVCLGIDVPVVHRMVVGAVDALHFERHPAAVAAQVVQELAVVARAAEAGNVWSHLLVAGIGRPFAHVAHGGERFQLVQLLALHLVQLLEAHQGKL